MAWLKRKAGSDEAVKNRLITVVAKVKASRRPINRSGDIGPDENHRRLPLSYRRAVKLESSSRRPATNEDLKPETSNVGRNNLKPMCLWSIGHQVESTIQDVRASGPPRSAVLKQPDVRSIDRLERTFILYV